jgi:hypothetical protein
MATHILEQRRFETSQMFLFSVPGPCRLRSCVVCIIWETKKSDPKTLFNHSDPLNVDTKTITQQWILGLNVRQDICVKALE